MKKEYQIPQSRIELAQMPQMMDEFLGIATVSTGDDAYCPPAVSGN